MPQNVTTHLLVDRHAVCNSRFNMKKKLHFSHTVDLLIPFVRFPQ